ncbi:hypothetical protein WICPIJ_000752 [Wickerhamomyces pijperi]|uniref:Uncharacterized protein n=1 Tax=Wickerhamomyces pijperi TaxID=599730 RepID=A0A9P8TS58_WICPI|nr:hypothetical protein WICPIJ_000752 [Wickerhamomyces pijperi]
MNTSWRSEIGNENVNENDVAVEEFEEEEEEEEEGIDTTLLVSLIFDDVDTEVAQCWRRRKFLKVVAVVVVDIGKFALSLFCMGTILDSVRSTNMGSFDLNVVKPLEQMVLRIQRRTFFSFVEYLTDFFYALALAVSSHDYCCWTQRRSWFWCRLTLNTEVEGPPALLFTLTPDPPSAVTPCCCCCCCAVGGLVWNIWGISHPGTPDLAE